MNSTPNKEDINQDWDIKDSLETFYNINTQVLF